MGRKEDMLMIYTAYYEAFFGHIPDIFLLKLLIFVTTYL
jgi:hypothetical protein